MHAKIVDFPSLYRDLDNQHIVETDTSMIRRHELRLKASEEKIAMKKEIEGIKSDVSEIKRLLQALIPVSPVYVTPYYGGGPADPRMSGGAIAPALQGQVTATDVWTCHGK